ncbi:MAG: CCA tRNA nucleotidyltransferase [Candidatus Korarchaeum sp.]|nr:CCA tRNA nucleotidyltransferase [Candidatus Korarchaeum sp.]
MQTSSKIKEVLERARLIVSPSDEERLLLERTLEEVLERVSESVRKLRLDAQVVPVGSAVRDTWLPHNHELDVFVLFPKEVGGKELLGSLILEIAEESFGDYEQNYAEHPYVKVKYNGFEVDLVPAYRISPGEKALSAVDRTPLHNSYVRSKLKSPIDARLLKAFLKSIDAYGAEERVGGFSGYLCELLIINYGDFLSLMESAANWGSRVYIDIEGHLNEEYALAAFNGPLVVIDPVDPRRNAAAALTDTQFNRFKVAAKSFLKDPDLYFFSRGLEESSKRCTFHQLERELSERRTRLIMIHLENLEDLSRELLWSQAKRLARLLYDELERNGFDPIWVSGWTDERSFILVAAELLNLTLPTLEKKQGPPVGSNEEMNFLRIYVNSRESFGGPFIEGDRWYVYRRRRYSEATVLINDVLNSGKMPPLLRGRAKFRILTDKELSLLDKWALSKIFDEMEEGGVLLNSPAQRR